MSATPVTVVRLYLTEHEGLDELLHYLHHEARVRGVTVFRGIAGFGRSGKLHTSRLLDVASDLPLVVEFFDAPGKARSVLTQLEVRFEPGHILTWPASSI